MCPRVTFDDTTHSYFIDGRQIPSVTSVLPRQEGHAYVSDARMSETAEDGKWRHHLVQQFMDRRASDPEPRTPLEKGIVKFLSEHPEFGEYRGSEVMLWSKYMYAGTSDLLFTRAVVDVKRTMGAKKYHALQTAGYHRAAVERGMISENRNHWILQLNDDGTYKAVNVWNELADVMFLSLVKAWWNPEQYRENVEKAIKSYLK